MKKLLLLALMAGMQLYAMVEEPHTQQSYGSRVLENFKKHAQVYAKFVDTKTDKAINTYMILMGDFYNLSESEQSNALAFLTQHHIKINGINTDTGQEKEEEDALITHQLAALPDTSAPELQTNRQHLDDQAHTSDTMASALEAALTEQDRLDREFKEAQETHMLLQNSIQTTSHQHDQRVEQLLALQDQVTALQNRITSLRDQIAALQNQKATRASSAQQSTRDARMTAILRREIEQKRVQLEILRNQKEALS